MMHGTTNIKITVHILQYITVMYQDTLQHFPPGSTSRPLSHTWLHVTNGLVWLKGRPCADALTHLYVYFISSVYITMLDGGWRVRFIYISSLSCKGYQMRTLKGATSWCILLRHCLTNRKFSSSITNGTFEIFHWLDPSGCTMALRNIQPLTEMSDRFVSWE